ncbi:ATP-binding protein [Streptomyces sp. TR06-5]|uniref:ATP-binding protein n=1 Tax=unclassified Streptomyces TaxID=2593676 RepID=UPI0039A14ED3
MERVRRERFSAGPAGEPLLPPPLTAAEARDRVTHLLGRHFGEAGRASPGDEVVVADALLVTSELATNAIRHAGGITAFRARIHRDRLIVTVSDGSDAVPRRQELSTTGRSQPGGYGWALTCRLARRLVVTRHHGGGKSVTAHLPLL